MIELASTRLQERQAVWRDWLASGWKVSAVHATASSEEHCGRCARDGWCETMRRTFEGRGFCACTGALETVDEAVEQWSYGPTL